MPGFPPAGLAGASRFFVVELIVRKPFRGHGYAQQLMNELLGGRPESFAALTTQLGGFAQAMYLRWGWEKVCKLALAHAPVTFDVMVLRLAG
jgi:GNAT superfamily N-acetyltransferase